MQKLKFTALEWLQLYDLDRRRSDIATDDLFFWLSKHGLHLDLRSFSGQDHKPLYFEGYQRPSLRSRTGITTRKAASDVRHTRPALGPKCRSEVGPRPGEFQAFGWPSISGNNSDSRNRNIGRDLKPFDNEIPPFNSRLSRPNSALEAENTGSRATCVLEKRSHLCYENQPQPSGDLEEEFCNGAAM